MFYRTNLLKKLINCYSVSIRYLPQFKTVFDMSNRKITVTHDSDSSYIGISFRVVNQLAKIDRVFNLNRPKDEKMNSVLSRISCNLTKAASKKKRKKDETPPDIPVKIIKINPKSDEICSINEAPDISLETDVNVPCVELLVNQSMYHALIIGDDSYVIDLNPPMVLSVDLPKNIMAGFPVYPSKFETRYANVDDCIFKWFRSNLVFSSEKDAKACLLNVSWENAHADYYYETSNEDIGRLLKLVVTPYFEQRSGEKAEVVSSVLISAGPGECSFQKRHIYTKEPSGNKRFRIVSYNILADLYADSDHSKAVLFPTCPAYAIDMDYRKQLLLKEIMGYNGDLICLQEVDEKIFLRDLEPLLGKVGLVGLFDPKGGLVTEGVALFYRRTKFRLLERKRIILSKELMSNPHFSEIWEKLQDCKVLRERVATRTTCLQVSVLENIEVPDRIIVVGVTHLYFHPDADHIRLFQVGMCMDILQQFISLYQIKYPLNDVSLFFCGDFNSTPEFGIYRFMTTQMVDADDPDWNSKPEERISGVQFSHSLEIESAVGCPSYTNYTMGFNGCLDYIFYQTDKFTLSQVIPMPSHEDVIEHLALPSITFPSDHIAIIADFQFKNVD